MTTLPAGALGEVTAGRLARPIWQQARFWSALLLLVLLGAGITALLSSPSGIELDPHSTDPSGSQALAVLLTDNGTAVRRIDSVPTHPTGTLLITEPDDYPDPVLRRLAASSARLVLVTPGTHTLQLLAPAVTATSDRVSGDLSSGCSWAGAAATGTVHLRDDAAVYAGATACYSGTLVLAGRDVIVGSAAVLSNAHLGDAGVAAMDVNAISDERTAASVDWLLPGADATSAAPTFWSVWPRGTERAVLWLLLVGLLVLLWRGRRLGSVVREPLPVVVRAAEVVEGHGRLYRRAEAADRAGTALRRASLARLRATLRPSGDAAPERVVDSVAAATGRRREELTSLLLGPPPATTDDLVRLVSDLDHLEAAAGVPPRRRTP